jgi:hypothetical protein
MTPIMSSNLLTTPLASCRVYARFLRSLYIWTCNTQAVAKIMLCVGSILCLSDCVVVLSLLSMELQSMNVTGKEWQLQNLCQKQLIMARVTIWHLDSIQAVCSCDSVDKRGSLDASG